jgi:hypothetical protein
MMRRFLRSRSQSTKLQSTPPGCVSAAWMSIARVKTLGRPIWSSTSASSGSSGERFALAIAQKASVFGGGALGLKDANSMVDDHVKRLCFPYTRLRVAGRQHTAASGTAAQGRWPRAWPRFQA